jgi:hypothetical protein
VINPQPAKGKLRGPSPICLVGEGHAEWGLAQQALVLVLLNIEEMDVLGEVSCDALDAGIEHVNGGKEDRVQPASLLTCQYLSLRVKLNPRVKVELGTRVRQQLVKFLFRLSKSSSALASALHQPG